MRFLKQNTATIVTVGPFFDKSDGVVLETALTIGNERISFTVDANDGNAPTLVLDDLTATTTGTANDLNYIAGCDAALMQLELAAANVNYVGRAFLTITDAANHCPVFHEFTILPATAYDYLITNGVADIANAVWDLSITAHNTTSTFGNITQLIKTGVDTASGNLTTIASGVSAISAMGTTTSSDLTTIKSGVATISANFTTLNSDIDTVSADLTTIKTGIGTISAMGTTTSSDLTTIKSGVATISANFTTLNSDIDTVSADLTTIKTGISTMSAMHTTVSSDLTTIKSGVSAISAMGTTTSSDLTTIKSGVATISANFTTLNSDIDTISADLTTIKSSLSAVPTVAGITTAIWDVSTTAHATTSTFGNVIQNLATGSGATLAQIEGSTVLAKEATVKQVKSLVIIK